LTSGGTETWRRQQPGTFKRRKPRRAPGWALALAVIGGILVLGSAASFAAVQTLSNRYEGAVHREDLLGAAGRDSAGNVKPPKVTGPLTFLVLGSDSRAGENANTTTRDGTAAAVGGQRSDTIIVAEIPKSMDRAYFISLPRDSYVPMVDQNGRVHGKDKLNAAFSRYGAAGMVQTVNHITGGHIDYPMIVDFAAVHKLTELVGGVDVVVDKTSVDTYRYLPANTPYSTVPHCRDIYGAKHVRCLQFKAGKLHLDPQLAEYYVRQRVGLPGGDLDRAKRQQQYMKALMNKIATTGFATNPVKFDRLVRTAAGAVTADKSMPIQSLAFSLQQLRPSALTFMSMPTAGFAKEPGSGSVVVVDPVKDQELFTALNSDTLEQYILKHPPNDVSHGA
jgi:LCP family protein required for cell wall assembly